MGNNRADMCFICYSYTHDFRWHNYQLRQEMNSMKATLATAKRHLAELNGLVPTDSEANTDSSNSPTEATQERKEAFDE